MSTRPLDGSRGHQGSIDTIESVADTKGVEIDDVEVSETTTDSGQEIAVFTIYETKAETEKDSVGIQVSRPTDGGMGEEMFRNSVNRAVSALKQHVSGEPNEEIQEELEEVQEEKEKLDEEGATTDGDRVLDSLSVDFDADDTGGGDAEVQLLAQRKRLEQRVEELEARVEELEGQLDSLSDLTKIADALNDD